MLHNCKARQESVMSDLVNRLNSSTNITPVRQQTADDQARANQMLRDSRDKYGQIDIPNLATKLANSNGTVADVAKSRLTPVQQGELARSLDLMKLPGATVQFQRTSDRPLTPVQQGEMERLALTQDFITTTPSVQTRGIKGFFSDIGDFFTGGNQGGDFFNEIGVPIALPDDPPSAPVAPPPPASPPPSSSPPDKKEPIPGERDPEDDVRPTPSPPPPPNSGSGAGAVPVSPPPPPSSGAGDPGQTPPDSGNSFSDKISDTINDAAESVADAVAHATLTGQAHRELFGEVAYSPEAYGAEVAAKLFEDTFKDVSVNDVLSGINSGGEFVQHLAALSNDPRAELGFAKGFAEGFGSGALNLAKGIGKIVQFAGDESLAGDAGDLLRGVTGRLPPYLDALVPSAQRGQETIAYTEQAAKNAAVYLASRATDPDLLAEDIEGFLSENWETLKGEWQTAHAAGPEAEGEWFGKIAGRAVFEIAATFIPADEVLAIGRAAEGAVELARGAEAISDLSKVETVAADAISAADKAIASEELAAATLEDLEKTQQALYDIDYDRFPDTPEGQAAIDKVEAAKEKVDQAVEAGHRIETPTPGSDAAGIKDPTVILKPHQTELLNNLSESGSVYTVTKTSSTALPTIEDISALTQKTGEEFSVFSKGDQSIIVRGDANGVDISPELLSKLQSEGWNWDFHSQPGYLAENAAASQADQELLKKLGQTESKIINSHGDVTEFTQGSKKAKFTEGNPLYEYENSTDFNNAANHAKPNSTYKYGDFTYETDEQGRTIVAEGFFDGSKPAGNRKSIGPKIGHEGIEGDIGFHLIGDQFGAETNRLNIVPGNKILNNNSAGNFGAIENMLAKEYDAGNAVMFQVKPVYNEGNLTNRPDSFEVFYQVNDGPQHNITFVNGPVQP